MFTDTELREALNVTVEELHRDKAPQSDSTASQVRVEVRPAKTCQRASAESYRKSKEENRRTFSLKTIVLLEDIFPNSSADHAQQVCLGRKPRLRECVPTVLYSHLISGTYKPKVMTY